MRPARHQVDVPTVIETLKDLEALGLRVTSMQTLMHPAPEVACAHQISAYDASYVALADRYHLPLLTADQRLIRQLSGTSHRLLPIEEIANAHHVALAKT